MKKFLSFFLVICMLISAVPALLLPVFAEEGEVAPNKIFSYADAYMNFTATVSETHFKYMGNTSKQEVTDGEYKAWLELPETFALSQGDYAWKAGEYDPATGTFEAFSRLAFYCQDKDWDKSHDITWFTTDTAYKAALDAYIEKANANDGLGGSSIWGGTPLMGQAKYNGFSNTNAAKAIGVVFTVAEEGIYKLFLDESFADGYGHKLAILVNGTPVWPLGATATDYTTWYLTSTTTTIDTLNSSIATAIPEVELFAGDKVIFAVQGGNMPMYWTPALEQLPTPEPVKFSFAEEFSVTYNISELYKMKGEFVKEGDNIVKGDFDDPDAFADAAAYLEWLLQDDTFKVDQGNSNWKIGQYSLEDGSLNLFTRIMFFAGDQANNKHDINWASTEEVYVDMATKYANGEAAGIWSGAPLWHLHAGAEWLYQQGLQANGSLRPGGMTNSGGKGLISAIQYTVAESGTYGVSFTDFGYAQPYEHSFAILVNNEIVWPESATTANTSSWYKVSSTNTTADSMTALLKPFSVKLQAGDKVSFCVAGDGNAVFVEPVLEQQPAGSIFLTLSDMFGSNTQAIKVRPNSTVTLPKYVGDLIFFGWDANGDGKADYEDEAEITIGEESISLNAVILEPSLFYNNRPVWDATTETVAFSGGWSMGIYEKATMTFLPLAYNSGDIFCVANASGPWGKTGGGFYFTNNRPCCTVVTGCVDAEILAGTDYARPEDEIGDYINSIQKVVDYNGTATIDFNKFEIGRELGAQAGTTCPVAGGMAIYINGEKIWPTTTDKEYFPFVSEEVYTDNKTVNYNFKSVMTENGTWPFPLTVDLEMGDVIDIRYVQGTADNWMLYSEPVVSYSALAETPTVSHTSVDIAKDFTLNIYADILAKVDGSVAHMEYWTAEPTAEQLAAGGTELELIATEGKLYKFAYTGLTAKQMSDVIYVRAYTTIEGGERINGGVAAVSIKDYAMSALGMDEALDNLLVAMLNYGAKAQALFDYNVDNLANSELTLEQKRATADSSLLVNAYANADGDNKIKSASLIMGTDLGLKFMIDSVEGATTYELEISKSADFADSTKIAMTAVWEGREQKAIYNISFADMDEVFYVRAVVDGTAGATLTYSVESFVVRMADHPDMGLYDATMALAYFNQMIVAYEA